MNIQIKSSDPSTLVADCLVVPVAKNKRLGELANTVDLSSQGQLQQLMKTSAFKGEEGNTAIYYDIAGIKAKRVMVVGFGNVKDVTHQSISEILKPVLTRLDQENCKNVAIILPEASAAPADNYSLIRQSTISVGNSTYLFDQCKSDKPDKSSLNKATFIVAKQTLAQGKKAVAHGIAISQGMTLARDLSNLPGNICTPTYLASEARRIGRKFKNLTTSILDEKDMEKLGMGSLLSVSRGSRQPAKLITMNYKGGKPGDKPVVLVGKGLTFDAGGISIKPSARMDEMKYDMCGGASVFGALQACAELELPINVVGIVPSSENLPDGDANKPGDIVTSMAGLTIEILNTDAEGRLILCDALTYADKFKPAVVIDIATLTGACIVALGHHISGMMTNNDTLGEALCEAGTNIHDRVWQLPLGEEYTKQLSSNFADLGNIGGPSAGTITAGCFLSKFTEKYKWAHLDIAGTAWMSGDNKGATGRPVPLLVNYLLKRARAR